MARSRTYSAAFSGVSVSAVQDLLGLYTTSTMPIELHGFDIGQITGTTSQNLRLTVKRRGATLTNGSGGSTPTPRKMLSGDSAAVTTAHANDTSQASTSGTPEVLHSDVFNTLNGISFFWPPNDIPTIGLSMAAIISLDSAPGSALVMNGTIYFGELL